MEALKIKIPKKKVTWETDMVRMSGRKRTREERDAAEGLLLLSYTAGERKASQGMLQLGK